MSISYNYFLPTNIFGTLRVTDLGFPGYTAVNANIYCQRNINSDGQMQCGSFKSLGASVFDQVPTCITNATTATQLTNYQTVTNLISASGGITAQQAIDAVHTSSQQFTVPQNIWNTLTFRAAGGSLSTTVLQHSDTIGYFIFTNTSSTGHYRFNVNTAGVQSSVLEMDSTLFKVRAGTAELNLTTVNALTCSNNATFNGAYPTTTLGSNTGVNNNEFATVGYAKSIGGTSILALNNIFTGTNTFNIPIASSGASITANTIPALSIVNNSLTNSQVATGFQLVTTNSQTFTGVKTFGSIPILPTGYEFLTTSAQTITGIKTLSSLLNSTGITDSVSISTPIMNAGYFTATSTGGTSTLYGTYVNGQLSANSLNTNLITNSSTTLPITISTSGSSSIPTVVETIRALRIGWNGFQPGQGASDFINCAQGGNGGFSFSVTNANFASRQLASLYTGGGLRLYSDCAGFRIDDVNNGSFNLTTTQQGNTTFFNSSGISTSISSACCNASGVLTTVLVLNTNFVSTYAPFTPQSTSLFNVSHPTTTLGNNISTNTTQYATVGFVNANSGTALLASNNTWTGNNSFFGPLRYLNIGAPSNALAFGASVGNSGSIIIGDSSSLATTTTSSGNICIAPPLSSSLYTTTGSNNICVGALSGTAITTGNNNLIYGASSGTGITTGSLNTVIGAGAWPTGNFSNCTVIGASAPSPVANNSIILGRTADTVYIKGAAEINNTLMTGTTVASANFQVNGNIINPVTLYSTGVLTTFTTIPALILYTPIAGMGFVLPAPNGTNSGQQFIIRRIATGGGQTINFTCTGAPAVWVNLNQGTGATSINVSTTWQLRFLSANNLFYQLA